MKKSGLFALLLVSLLGGAATQAAQGLPQIIQDAADGRIEGCTVKLWADGWANQLYVRGTFAGNFDENKSFELANALEAHLRSGKCNYVGQRSALPRLVRLAANNQIQGCTVKLWVDGWANQLYVLGAFAGNFSDAQNADLENAIQANLYSGKCRQNGQASNLPLVIQDAANGAIEGCSVKLWVDGWANQLYIRGTFAGNFGAEQTNDLEAALNQRLSTGRCSYTNGPSALPPLVRAASSGQMEGCEVKLWVDGWANQLYVRGAFAGNFAENEINSLEATLRSHVNTGRCIDRSYPTPRPNYYPTPVPARPRGNRHGGRL